MKVKSKLKTALSVVRNFGIIELLRIPFRRITRHIIIQKKHTLLNEKHQRVVHFSVPSLAFLHDCGLENISRGIVVDYNNYLMRLSARTAKPREGFFGEIYDLGPGLGFILFHLIQTRNPVKVIETGIAAGASSNLILYSMDKSGLGSLTSIDITSKVGELVEDDFKVNWTTEILPSFFKKKAFQRILKNNSEAEVFLHDSDHSLDWQIFEIDSVLNSLPNIEFILVDDVSEDFRNYVEVGIPDWRLVVINEGRKYSGFLYKKNLASNSHFTL